MEESELIDRYLRRELNEMELQEFEARLAIDAELRKAVELRRLIIGVISSSYEDELKMKLRLVDSKITSKKQIKFYTMAIATLVIILSLGIGLFVSKRSKDSKIAKYDIPEIGLPNLMGKSEISESNSLYRLMLNEGMNYFKKEDYKRASKTFDELYANVKNDTVAYYAGISHFRDGSNEKAIFYFERIAKDIDSPYKTRAEYRLGLSYWKAGNLKKAIEHLSNVKKDSVSDYSNYSKQILVGGL
jgi:tetratricopeptide (TPR) repeat protein